MRSSLLVLAMASLAACSFSPQPPNGAQECGTGTPRCPDGYFCGSDNRCYQNGYVIDASADGASADGATADGIGQVDSSWDRGVTEAGTPGDTGAGSDLAQDDLSGADVPLGDGPAVDGPMGSAIEAGGESRADEAPNVVGDAGPDAPADLLGSPDRPADNAPDLPPLLCAGTTKKCGEACVSITDPAYGCAAANCAACPAPANSSATCNAGTCGSTCLDGYLDCDGSATNGCEINSTNNPTNCGACGHDCLGGDCVAGKCQPVTMATNQLDPADMTVDANNVYWTATGDGKVLSLPRLATTAATPTVIADNQAAPKGILLDSGYVYWSNYSNVGSIRRRALPVAASSPHAPVISSGYYPYRMAIAGSRLYWTEDSTAGSVRVADISSVSSGPVDPTVLFPSQGSPKGIAVDTANLYWTIYGEVRQATLSTLTVSKISASESFPYDLRADATTLYWSDGYASTIRKAPKNTVGAASTIATLSGAQRPLQITLDATSVYWANPEGGAIQSVSKQGGAIQLWYQSSANKPQGIAVDGQNIYWTDSLGGKVYRLAK